MRKSELDRLLESAVAEALGLTPRRARKSKQAKPASRTIRRPSYQLEHHASH